MGCNRCGKPTSKRQCDQCSLATGDGRVATDYEVYECPACGGETSGEGVRCRHCREVEA